MHLASTTSASQGVIGEWHSRVGPAFHCIDLATSDELMDWARTNMVEVHLFQAQYEAIGDDGANKWSVITELKSIGCLWNASLRAPLLSGEPAAGRRRGSGHASQRLLSILRFDDPLSAGSAGGAPWPHFGLGVGGRRQGWGWATGSVLYPKS